MKQIKTQKQLDALCKKGIKQGEEYEIIGTGLKLNTHLSVYGFLRVSGEVGMSWSSRVVARESSHVEARESSHVEAWGSSRVEAWGSSHVEARESSHVEARGSSLVEARGSSHVVARESSHVVARESSHVEAWGSSRVEARGSVSVRLYSVSAQLSLFGWAVAFKHFTQKGNITKTKGTTVIQVPEMKETFEAYEARYPVVKKGGKYLFYKAVHKEKNGNRYFSDFNKSFFYELGKTYEHENAPASSGCCSTGLHIAHLSWARMFGSSWEDLVILECEVAKKDIVVPQDTDGKIRCSKLKVVREVPESEWYG